MGKGSETEEKGSIKDRGTGIISELRTYMETMRTKLYGVEIEVGREKCLEVAMRHDHRNKQTQGNTWALLHQALPLQSFLQSY
jgi:hypothetical protein